MLENPSIRAVLLVCAGNICRSPMGAGLLAHRLRSLPSAPTVESAGIAALVNQPADPLACALLAERGLDLSAHRARQLTPILAAAFELILVMDDRQQRAVEKMFPAARGRVHRLGRFVGFDIPCRVAINTAEVPAPACGPAVATRSHHPADSTARRCAGCRTLTIRSPKRRSYGSPTIGATR